MWHLVIVIRLILSTTKMGNNLSIPLNEYKVIFYRPIYYQDDIIEQFDIEFSPVLSRICGEQDIVQYKTATVIKNISSVNLISNYF